MVSALDSGLSGLGLRPSRVVVLCSSERHLTLTVPRHPGVNMGTSEWSGKPDEVLWGGENLGMERHPFKAECLYPSSLHTTWKPV